jgi:hypothetical protein
MILKMAFVLTKRILTALTITRGHRNDYSRIRTMKICTMCNCDGNEFVTPMAKSSEPCVAIFAMANFEAQKPANAKLDISRFC